MNRDLLVIIVVGFVLLAGTVVVDAFPHKNSVVQADETRVSNHEELTVEPEIKDDLSKKEIDSEPKTQSDEHEIAVKDEPHRDRDIHHKNTNVETISAAEISYIEPMVHKENSPKEEKHTEEKSSDDSEKQPQQSPVKNQSSKQAEQPKQNIEQKPSFSSEKQLKQKKQLSKEEAIAVATNMTPGKVVEVEYDDGEYEIEIVTNTHEVSYEIDAKSGRILEKEVDDLDDDD